MPMNSIYTDRTKSTHRCLKKDCILESLCGYQVVGCPLRLANNVPDANTALAFQSHQNSLNCVLHKSYAC